MKKLTILIDMDDVLNNLTEAWVETLNIVYDYDIDWKTIDEWDMTKFYPKLSKKQIFNLLKIHQFWDMVKPIEGAVGFTRLLMQDHNIYIVTNSHYKTIQPKIEEFFIKYFPFIPLENIIITSNKQIIKGDVLIDDAPFDLTGGDYAKILLDKPYNRDFDENSIEAIRVYNWSEIYKEIKRIANS